ncbi:hypothetical protein [Krasilnikovia sp. M28-CT-15]|uniref:hypothetical protein n=1 Tax=Krasilnikovia sp. M28-CT-15 TaxID=3373540 RepID=UPI0038767305
MRGLTTGYLEITSMLHSARLAAIGMALLTPASLGVVAAPAQAATSGLAAVVETTKVQYKAAKASRTRSS